MADFIFDASVIAKLKQKNAGNGGSDIKARVKGVWANASTEQRAEILERSGLSKNTAERSYRTGLVPHKLALALAFVLNVNPYYLLNEADDPSLGSDDILRDFVIYLGYDYNKLAGIAKKTAGKPGRKPGGKPAKKAAKRAPRSAGKAAAEPIAVIEEAFDSGADFIEIEPIKPARKQRTARKPKAVKAPTASTAAPVAPAVENTAVQHLSDEDILALVHALHIRAGLGIADAADKLAQVTRLLLN